MTEDRTNEPYPPMRGMRARWCVWRPCHPPLARPLTSSRGDGAGGHKPRHRVGDQSNRGWSRPAYQPLIVSCQLSVGRALVARLQCPKRSSAAALASARTRCISRRWRRRGLRPLWGPSFASSSCVSSATLSAPNIVIRRKGRGRKGVVLGIETDLGYQRRGPGVGQPLHQAEARRIGGNDLYLIVGIVCVSSELG